MSKQLLTANGGIHPTALIDPGAELAEGVNVGAFSIIGPGVKIDAGTTVGPHVTIKGRTTIGADNLIYQFASVGDDPQDKKFAGEDTLLEIGDRNVIRECCTLNRGTIQDNGLTRIGSDNLLMAYVHVAHDCIIGDNVILANNCQLAGHVTIGDWAIFAGNTAAHQFTKIGAHAFCGHDARITMDVLPYTLVMGDPARARTLNSVGLRRRGFTDEDRSLLKKAFRILCRKGLELDEAITELHALGSDVGVIKTLLDFIAASERGIAR